MDIDYKVGELNEKLISEMIHRQDEYWKEVASPFHAFPPDVDWKSYRLLQEAGRLKVICGRDDKDELKAIAFILIAPHPHYSCILASIPLIYLVKESRNGREGMKLIKAVEHVSESSGAQLLITHGGIHNDVAKIFEFMKYDDFGRYFVKKLNSRNGENPIFKGE